MRGPRGVPHDGLTRVRACMRPCSGAESVRVHGGLSTPATLAMAACMRGLRVLVMPGVPHKWTFQDDPCMFPPLSAASARLASEVAALRKRRQAAGEVAQAVGSVPQGAPDGQQAGRPGVAGAGQPGAAAQATSSATATSAAAIPAQVLQPAGPTAAELVEVHCSMYGADVYHRYRTHWGQYEAALDALIRRCGGTARAGAAHAGEGVHASNMHAAVSACSNNGGGGDAAASSADGADGAAGSGSRGSGGELREVAAACGGRWREGLEELWLEAPARSIRRDIIGR